LFASWCLCRFGNTFFAIVCYTSVTSRPVHFPPQTGSSDRPERALQGRAPQGTDEPNDAIEEIAAAAPDECAGGNGRMQHGAQSEYG
jgi:hypothetical protein